MASAVAAGSGLRTSSEGRPQMGPNDVRVMSKRDGAVYILNSERVRVGALSALFGAPISFLEHDNRPIFPTSQGLFLGLVPGKAYLAVAQPGSEAKDQTAQSLSSSKDADPIDQRTAVLKVFRRFDTNHSGDIDSQEFRALVLELGKDISVEQTREIFNLIDVDKSGVIDFTEFYAWWRSFNVKSLTASSKSGSGIGSGLLSSLRTFGNKLLENPNAAQRTTQSPTVELISVRTHSPAVAAASDAAAAVPRISTSMAQQLKWIPVTEFADGWSAPSADSGLRAASYCFSESTGAVLLRGCAVGKQAGVCFTLPAAARPSATERFACLKGTGDHAKLSAITVAADGSVSSSSAGEVWLSGVSFFK